jgi:hypothetical protein
VFLPRTVRTAVNRSAPPPNWTNHRSFILLARTRVGQVRAADKDFPQSSVVYSISTGGASLQYPNIFWINPKTGELQLVTKADYETTPIYVLRIQATNGEDWSSVTVSGVLDLFTSFQLVALGSSWHPLGVAAAMRKRHKHVLQMSSEQWCPGHKKSHLYLRPKLVGE